MLRSHVSLNMVFGLIVIRWTTFRSWSRAYLRLPLHRAHRQLQNHYRRKIKVQHLCQCRLIVGEHKELFLWEEPERNYVHEPRIETQPKIQNPIKRRITHTNGVTRLLPKYLNGCKNSGEISWMGAFLNLMDPEFLFSVTRTRALPSPTTKIPKPKENVDHEQVRGDPSFSEIPGWLEEFTQNLVDERVPEHRDSHASSSHEPSLEPLRRMVSGDHRIYSHFPKDRNCEICQRTKITRGPCRRRIGGVVPRAEILVSYIQRITQFSVTEVNLATVIDMQLWYKT